MDMCCICQVREILDGHFWVCPECEKKFGLDKPFREWPQWAKEARRFERAERRFDHDLETSLSFERLAETSL